MKLRPQTIRKRLTLSTVGSLAVLYVLLCVVVRTVAWKTIWSSVDANLTDRAKALSRGIRWDLENRNLEPPPPKTPAPREEPGNPFGMRVVWIAENVDLPMRLHPAYDQTAVGKAQKGEREIQTLELQGKTCRLLTWPVHDRDGKLRAVIQIPASMEDFQRSLQGLDRTLFILLPAGLVLMAFASVIIVNRVIRPMRRISEDAARIGANNLGERIEVSGEDEFAELGRTINGMLGRVENAFLLQQKSLDQLEASVRQQRRFTADASHELKTPLSVVKVHAGLIGRSDDPDLRHSAEEIDHAVARMTKLVNDLLVLARTDSGQIQERIEECDLRAIAEQAAVGIVAKNIVLRLPEEPVFVRCSPDALERLMINILANACRHTSADGTVTLEIRQGEGEAVVTIADTGEGISPQHLPHIFERFYRGDDGRASDTGGTGLGLAICKGIVEAHRGTIEAESELGHGSRFTIRLPRAIREAVLSGR